MGEILNQFNNFCYQRVSVDLKMKDLCETSNQREYLKCWTKFYKKSISQLSIIDSIQYFLPSRQLVKIGCVLSEIYFKVA